MSDSFFSRRVFFEFLVFRDDFGFVPAVVVVGKLEEGQTQHRRGILAGFEVGVGAEIVSRAPKIRFELFELVFRHLQ